MTRSHCVQGFEKIIITQRGYSISKEKEGRRGEESRERNRQERVGEREDEYLYKYVTLK